MQLAGMAADRSVLPLCTVDLAAPAPQILASRVVGMGSVEMVQRVIAFGDGLRQKVPKSCIFHDFTRRRRLSGATPPASSPAEPCQREQEETVSVRSDAASAASVR